MDVQTINYPSRTGGFRLIKTPFDDIDLHNPIFIQELKGIKRLGTARALKRYMLLLVIGGNLCLLALWLIALALDPDHQLYSDSYIRSVQVTSALSLILSLVASLYYTIISANAISRHSESGHWEMLAVTPLSHQDILNGIYAAVQVRAWRLMTVLRAIGITRIMLQLYFTVGNGSGLRYFGSDLPIVVLTVASYMIQFIGAYWSPIWSMRAFISLGLAASSRIRNPVYAGLAALAGIGATMLIFYFVITRIILFLLFDFSASNSWLIEAYGVVTLLLSYGTYWMVRKLSWRAIFRYAFKQG